ncbi:MAG: hypothetical protein ABEH86_09685 [Haloarcula sp.]
MDRRRFLATFAGGTVVGLAGCNSGLRGPSRQPSGSATSQSFA